MTPLDFTCPTCGAGPTDPCVSEKTGKIVRPHLKRAVLAFPRTRSNKPPPLPESLFFRYYGGPTQEIDKTSPLWHTLERLGRVMASWSPAFTSEAVDLIKRMEALDEMRARGDSDLTVEQAELYRRIHVFCSVHYPHLFDLPKTLCVLMGAVSS